MPKEELIQLEECLLRAQNAARALAQAAAKEMQNGRNWEHRDLWGTINVNLSVLRTRCEEALGQIKYLG